MRSRLLLGAALTLLISYRLLSVANFQSTTAIGIARSQGAASTLLGTVVPVLSRLLPLLAAILAGFAVATTLLFAIVLDDEEEAGAGLRAPFWLLCGAGACLLSALAVSDVGGRSVSHLLWAGFVFGVLKIAGLVILAILGILGWACYRITEEHKSDEAWKQDPTLRELVALYRPHLRPTLQEMGVRALRKMFPKTALRAELGDATDGKDSTDPARTFQPKDSRERNQSNHDAEGGPEPRKGLDSTSRTTDQELDAEVLGGTEPTAPEEGLNDQGEEVSDIAVGRFFLILAGVLCLCTALGFPDARRLTLQPLEVARTMWLPQEELSFAATTPDTNPRPAPPKAVVGYVLATDGQWVTVLLGKERVIRYYPAEDLVSRTVCIGKDGIAPATALPRWHSAQAARPELPQCAG